MAGIRAQDNTGIVSRDAGETHKKEIPFVDLKAQLRGISDEVEKAIGEVLSNCDFILGEKVARFEKEFAAYCGAQYSVGVSSGTEALHLALLALGVGPGDEVITQANTFIATPLAISYTGATPVFVDVDPATFNMDPSRLEDALTDKTKAVVPVHLYGRVTPMDEITAFAQAHSLAVVEDACQAHGAIHYGKNGAWMAGTMGDAAAFSFYPGKNLGAYGDAGIVTTNNEQVFEEIRMLRNYGQKVKYHHARKGFNSRLDTLQAAVLLVKLRKLNEWNSMRVENARLYSELLEGIDEVVAPEYDFASAKKLSHVFHLYVVRAQRRDALVEHLRKNGVSAQIHYPVPCHLQEAFRNLGYAEGDFPMAEELSREIVSLPMYPELTEEAVERVVQAIEGFYAKR